MAASTLAPRGSASSASVSRGESPWPSESTRATRRSPFHLWAIPAKDGPLSVTPWRATIAVDPPQPEIYVANLAMTPPKSSIALKQARTSAALGLGRPFEASDLAWALSLPSVLDPEWILSFLWIRYGL